MRTVCAQMQMHPTQCVVSHLPFEYLHACIDRFFGAAIITTLSVVSDCLRPVEG